MGVLSQEAILIYKLCSIMIPTRACIRHIMIVRYCVDILAGFNNFRTV